MKNKRLAALPRSAGPCKLCAVSSLIQKSDLSWAQDSHKCFGLPKMPPPLSYSHTAVYIHLQFRKKATNKKQSQSYCVALCHFHLTRTTRKWHMQQQSVIIICHCCSDIESTQSCLSGEFSLNKVTTWKTRLTPCAVCFLC